LIIYYFGSCSLTRRSSARALLRDDDSGIESDCEGDEMTAQTMNYTAKSIAKLITICHKSRTNAKQQRRTVAKMRFYFLDDEQELLDQVLENHSCE
jgi:hypothetical protein